MSSTATELIVRDILSILKTSRELHIKHILLFMIICPDYETMRECKHECVKRITDLVFICDEMLEGARKENIINAKYNKSIIPPEECCVYICNSDEKYTGAFGKEHIYQTYVHRGK